MVDPQPAAHGGDAAGFLDTSTLGVRARGRRRRFRMARTESPEITETEEQLVQRAQAAVSLCNWEVGLCAVQWTRRYARGRTDADFAAMVGLSADQVFQRRRVVETFGEIHSDFPSLKWSHFYSALNWDDARDCLQWSEENQATVAEMKAWRRAIRGEDLTAEPVPDEFAGDPAILQVSGGRAEVRDVGPANGNGGARNVEPTQRVPTVAGAARGNVDDGSYAPFRSGAGAPAPGESHERSSSVGVQDRPSALRVIKRATAALVRINQSITDDVLDEFPKLPKKVREQFTAAVAELSSNAAALL
jgi:hypothetical protein